VTLFYHFNDPSPDVSFHLIVKTDRFFFTIKKVFEVRNELERMRLFKSTLLLDITFLLPNVRKTKNDKKKTKKKKTKKGQLT